MQWWKTVWCLTQKVKTELSYDPTISLLGIYTKESKAGTQRDTCSQCSWVCSLAELCPTLCDSMDCSPPGSTVHGIFQARILEWLPFPTSGDLPGPGIKPSTPVSPALAGGFFTMAPPGDI